jgi:hypothetical protein
MYHVRMASFRPNRTVVIVVVVVVLFLLLSAGVFLIEPGD